MTPRIRRAASSDFAAIDAFDPFAGDRAIEIVEGRMLGAEIEGELAGYVSWLPRGFVGRDLIAYLCVEQTFRRQGVARALLDATVTTLPPGRIFISTEADNTPMLTLLATGGWHRAGAVEGANERGQAEVFFYLDVRSPAA